MRKRPSGPLSKYVLLHRTSPRRISGVPSHSPTTPLRFSHFGTPAFALFGRFCTKVTQIGNMRPSNSPISGASDPISGYIFPHWVAFSAFFRKKSEFKRFADRLRGNEFVTPLNNDEHSLRQFFSNYSRPWNHMDSPTMKYRSIEDVLIGEETAKRPWVKFEIKKT